MQPECTFSVIRCQKMLSCDLFFRYCAEWHEHKELRSLLCENDSAVHLLSASQLRPSRWYKESTDDSGMERFRTRILILVHSECCKKVTSITQEEMTVLRDSNSIQMWWCEYRKEAQRTITSDEIESASKIYHGDAPHSTDALHAAEVIEQLLNRAHDCSCLWKGSAPMRCLFSSGNCFSLLESPVARLFSAALRVKEDGKDGKKSLRLTLPRAISPRFISAEALKMHRIIFNRWPAHIRKELSEMSSVPLHWKLHNTTFPARLTNAFSSPILSVVEALLEDQDDEIRQKEDIWRLSILVCHQLALLGFETMEGCEQERIEMHSVQEDIFGVYHLRCRYCGAAPRVETIEREAKRSTSNLGLDASNPTAECHDKEACIGALASTTLCTTVTFSGLAEFNTHCQCCPWNNLFLSPVLQSISSSESTYSEVTFALTSSSAPEMMEEDSCSSSTVVVDSAAPPYEKHILFRFRYDEMAYLLSCWRLRGKLSDTQNLHASGALELPEFQDPLFNKAHALDVSKCLHLATRGSSLYISPEKVDAFLNTLQTSSDQKMEKHGSCLPLQQKCINNMEVITNMMLECFLACEPTLTNACLEDQDLEAIEKEVLQIGYEFYCRGDNKSETSPDCLAATTTLLSPQQFDMDWEKLEQYYLGSSNGNKTIEHQSRLLPFYDAVVGLGTSFSNSRVVLEESIRGLEGGNEETAFVGDSGDVGTAVMAASKREREETRTPNSEKRHPQDKHEGDLRSYVTEMEGVVKKLRQERMKDPPPAPYIAGSSSYPLSSQPSNSNNNHHPIRPPSELPILTKSKPGNAEWNSSSAQLHHRHHQKQQQHKPFPAGVISPQPPAHPPRGAVFPSNEWTGSSPDTTIATRIPASLNTAPVLPSARPSVLGSTNSGSILGAAPSGPSQNPSWYARGGGGGGILSDSSSRLKPSGGHMGKFSRRGGGGNPGEKGFPLDGVHNNLGANINSHTTAMSNNTSNRGGGRNRGGGGGRQKSNRGGGNWRGGRGN